MPVPAGATRRQALTIAGSAAAVLGTALGPFGHLLTAGAAEPDESPEIALATFLVGLELAAADLYSTLASSSTNDAVGDLASACETNHTAQSKALGGMVSAAGGQVPTAGNDTFTKQFSSQISGDPTSAAQALTEMENDFAATYLAGLSTIASVALATIVAQILATDAAQATAWSAVANGTGAAVPVPAQDALPTSQTTDGAFAQSDFAETTTTTTTGAGS